MLNKTKSKIRLIKLKNSFKEDFVFNLLQGKYLNLA